MACSCYRQSQCLCISLHYQTAQSQQNRRFSTDNTEIIHSEADHPPSVSKAYFPAIDFNASFYSKKFQVKFSTLPFIKFGVLYMIHNHLIIRIYTIMHTSTLKLVYIQSEIRQVSVNHVAIFRNVKYKVQIHLKKNKMKL
jgi:hypothetical protein